jgi:hypothetical protein
MSLDYLSDSKINNCSDCNGTGIQGWIANTDGDLYDVTACEACKGEPTEKWIIRAVFRHNDTAELTSYTFYDNLWWASKDECLYAIQNAPMMETLTQTATLDSENEDDLQGFYFDDFEPYLIPTDERINNHDN